MRLIGIDCATEESKIGLALGHYAHGTVDLLDVTLCSKRSPPAAIIREWIQSSSEKALLAFDSPLGWPSVLGNNLVTHVAGSVIPVDSDLMFRRHTDRWIREHGHQPLDVGADRIARTALATLKLLDRIRRGLGDEIPLAWSHLELAPVSAIEVYPAATLRAHGLPATEYKKPSQVEARRRIALGLARRFQIEGLGQIESKSADELDAVVCIAAAKDFVDGRAVPPSDRKLAEKEGWIWAAKKSGVGGSAPQ